MIIAVVITGGDWVIVVITDDVVVIFGMAVVVVVVTVVVVTVVVVVVGGTSGFPSFLKVKASIIIALINKSERLKINRYIFFIKNHLLLFELHLYIINIH